MLVVFAGWALGVVEATFAALVLVFFGFVQVYRGHLAWQQVVIAGYAMVFLVGLIWMAMSRFTQKTAQLDVAIKDVQSHKEQLGVLFQTIEQDPSSVLIVDLEGLPVYANRVSKNRALKPLDPAFNTSPQPFGLTPTQYTQMRQRVDAGQPWQGLVHSVYQDKSEVFDEVRIAPVLGDVNDLRYMIEIRRDITGLMEAEKRVRHLQKEQAQDPLTKLPNQKALQQRLEAMLKESAAAAASAESFSDYEYPWHALLLLDIDRFQEFSTAQGGKWTDNLLKATVERLDMILPGNAWMARMTSHQFAVILVGAGATRVDARMRAVSLAETLQRGMASLIFQHDDGLPVKASSSVGLTLFPFVEPGRTADSRDLIVRRASVALAQAQQLGGGQTQPYSEELGSAAQRRLEIERELYTALQEGQLSLFVQPQVNLMGEVASLEALVRWQHPVRGLVSPAEFISIAESSGLIIPMGDWVLEQVCQMLRHPVVDYAGYGISANVSAMQLMQPDFVSKVEVLMQRYQIPANRLTLEITESLLLHDVEQIIQKMHRLGSVGVKFALDDFGTGYSSLVYLMRLPIHEIKLDQAFIRDLNPESHNTILVEALLMVAKRRGFKVVAEGVELSEQADLLQAWDPSILCQGYLFSKPVPATEWLKALVAPAAA